MKVCNLKEVTTSLLLKTHTDASIHLGTGFETGEILGTPGTIYHAQSRVFLFICNKHMYDVCSSNWEHLCYRSVDLSSLTNWLVKMLTSNTCWQAEIEYCIYIHKGEVSKIYIYMSQVLPTWTPVIIHSPCNIEYL